MTAERKGRTTQPSDLEKALTQIERDAIAKDELSRRIDLIVSWLKKNGKLYESNGDDDIDAIDSDADVTIGVGSDEDYDEILGRPPLEQVQADENHEEPENLLIGNGNGNGHEEEEHKYKFYQFEKRHRNTTFIVVGTDDPTTIDSNDERMLAIEHETRKRKISIVAYAEDAPDDAPYPQPEKSISMLVEFGKPEDPNRHQFFLPKTTLNMIDPNNMTVIQGVVNEFVNTFIVTGTKNP